MAVIIKYFKEEHEWWHMKTRNYVSNIYVKLKNPFKIVSTAMRKRLFCA